MISSDVGLVLISRLTAAISLAMAWAACAGGPTSHCDVAEVVGDGVDQNCDGSDYRTLSAHKHATGVVHWYGYDFGARIDCGPDRAGDGEGDIVVTAPNDVKLAFAAAFPGSLVGTHVAEDVLDMHVTVPIGAVIGDVALVASSDGGGVLMGLGAPRLFAPNVVGAVHVLKSGRVDRRTGAFGWQEFPTTGYSLGDVIAGPSSVGGGHSGFLIGSYYFRELPSDFSSVEKEGVLLVGREGGLGSPYEEITNYEADVQTGDLNGDGVEDVTVAYIRDPLVTVAFGPLSLEQPAVPGNDGVGRYGVLSRDETSHRIHSVAIGDLDGDGANDLALGDVFFGGRRGAVFVWFGPLTPGDHDIGEADLQIDGEAASAFFGISLAAADVNDDGVDELLVGAPDSSRQGPGLVYLLGGGFQHGSSLESSLLAVLRGETIGSAFGTSLQACDLDRDGTPGFLVGAPDADIGDIADGGAVYWYGSSAFAELEP